jgi:GTP-binding protein YchF
VNLAGGIVGLPNVGKSTLFNAITAAGAEVANYPFCTIEPNVGIVNVPDERLETIHRFIATEKVIPATLKVVDIAGIVAGASRGEGLGNKFLAHIRETQAILHVVRCFEGGDVTHVSGKVDPLSDIGTIETELVLADLETLERARDRVAKKARGQDKPAQAELAAYEKAIAHLSAGRPARSATWTEAEAEVLGRTLLITSKPVLYVANVSEDDLAGASPLVAAVRRQAAESGAEVVVLCAKLEQELAEMAPADRREFLDDLGMDRPGLERLVQAAFHLLGLMTFFTAGPKEIRAWTIARGDSAPRAAGAIHTDFEQHFIRAEIYSVDDLVELKTEAAIRAAGRLRVEGRQYVMRDADVAHFLVGC